MAKRSKMDKQQRFAALNALHVHELEAKAITMSLSPASNLKKAKLINLIMTKPAAKVTAKETSLEGEEEAKQEENSSKVT